MLITLKFVIGFFCLAVVMSPTVQAAEQWFLMSRHGECFEIGALKRKIPDLEGIKDPDAFTKLMRQRGYAVTSTQTIVAKGQAQEINVPQMGLQLIFVTSEICLSAK